MEQWGGPRLCFRVAIQDPLTRALILKKSAWPKMPLEGTSKHTRNHKPRNSNSKELDHSFKNSFVRVLALPFTLVSFTPSYVLETILGLAKANPALGSTG